MNALLTISMLVALAQAPSGWQETYQRASRLLLDEKGGEAIALLERVVEQAPDFDEARYELAGAHRYHALSLGVRSPSPAEESRRHFEKAAEHYRRLASSDSAYKLPAVGTLMMLYGSDELDQLPEVVVFARQYVALRPESAVGHVTLARALRTLGDHAAATRAFLSARSSVESDEQLLLAVSVVDDLTKDVAYDAADLRALIEYVEPVLERAIAEDPDDRGHAIAKAAVLTIRAQRLESDPLRQKALRDEADRLVFRRSSQAGAPAENPPLMSFVEVATPEFDAARAQAEALLQRQDYAQAVEIYDAFIASQPTFPNAYYDRVGALLAGGRVDLVPPALSAARKALPRDAATRHRMGRCLVDLARRPAIAAGDARTLLSEAVELLDEALAVGSGIDLLSSLETKRLVLIEQARHATDAAAVDALSAEAVRLATRAEALSGSLSGAPAGFAAAETEAAVLEARHQYGKAAGVYDAFVAAHPAYFYGHYERVRLRLAEGRHDLANTGLLAARASLADDAETRYMMGAWLGELARKGNPDATDARALLIEANRYFDDTLRQTPNHLAALVYKRLSLTQLASLETDAKAADALRAEAARLMTQIEALRSVPPR